MAEEYAAGPPFPAAVTVPDAQYAHGALLLAAGRRREARAELAAVGDRLEPRGRRNPAWCPWAGHLALALADEDPGQARRLAEQAVRRARHFGTASAEGSALRIAAAVGDRSAALGLLERAVLRLGESPCGYELALALVDHGAALRLAGRTGEAAQQLQHGIELALECGADGLAERARSELAAAGRQSSLLRLPGRDKLDHAERRIAEFAAGGLSVAAIAERLCSPATEIARRLSAACRKLGTDVPGLAAALCLPPGQPERS
jgi:tetratricopeptide (TPR) repeat protein